ncbi:hypothetical protein DRW41_18905 [Neobacillus piezotolerans]|uniref:F0F1 ATP synthase subunit B n=1 Tax=Neobacillus piezotolerans TaxID=2259171 RepID=A0A3D8GLP3_9BACI|nr:ATP synthase F0 subunit B [Neobacillus piezotolerans]RDU35353.1 hypothetical protein DRW41_18905 [Neobacillus piezotolerans]
MGDFEIFGIPISLGTMIYQALIFTILVFLIKKLAMKKLLGILENRKTYIGQQLTIAEQCRSEAELKLAVQESLLSEARQIKYRSEIEAREILEKAVEEAKEIIHSARDEARRIRSNQNQNKGA